MAKQTFFDIALRKNRPLPIVIVPRSAPTGPALWQPFPKRADGTHQGWRAVCRGCDGPLYVFDTPRRPAAVKCPGCGKWTVTP
jgi:hypothetical protein